MLRDEEGKALDDEMVGLALGPAAVLLRDELPRLAFPMAGRDAAAAIPPMPKGEPGTTTKEASIVAMRIGDGRWSARDRCSIAVSSLLGRRRSVLAAAMVEVEAAAKNEASEPRSHAHAAGHARVNENKEENRRNPGSKKMEKVGF